MKMNNKVNRRYFIYFTVIFFGLVFIKPVNRLRQLFSNDGDLININESQLDQTKRSELANNSQKKNRGCSKDGYSDVYLARDGSPEQNMKKIMYELGGIEKLISNNDIVILKPNAQWWSQGMTNTDSMRTFIEEILNIPNFQGEIIIAENLQYSDPNSRGWTTEKRNGKFNLNELVDLFQNAGYENVTKYHWQCAGPNPNPLEGDASSAANIVKDASNGDGYVWRDDIVYHSPIGRQCMMTYPVFTSSYSGVTIDFKNGAWKAGEPVDRPIKFVNFSALNHHGVYAGMTASIKNYMGIVDMTCGYQGSTPRNYFNTHFIGLRFHSLSKIFKHLPWIIKSKFDSVYTNKYFHHTGSVLGTFMREVRIADINFITAHWVGYGSRTNKEKSGYPQALLASTDPVALDCVAGEKILFTLTQEKVPDDKDLQALNNPANKNGPAYKFIEACHLEGIGNLSASKIRIHETKVANNEAIS